MEYQSRLVHEKTDGQLKELMQEVSWIDPERKQRTGEVYGLNRDGKPDPSIGNWKGRRRGSYLRKTFMVSLHDAKDHEARLYATAHGLYDVWLNGRHVDGYLLSPGNSQYDQRLMVQEYDVGDLLKEGENEILVSLGDGWYRGCCHNTMDTDSFGKDIALLLRLDLDGAMILGTGESWEATDQGPLGVNDLMMGGQYDASRKSSAWHPVRVRRYGTGNLIASGVPVTPHESFKAHAIHTPDGSTVLDFGQNMGGFVSLDLQAEEGTKIILTHGETLDENGSFTTVNFQNQRKPYCAQRIEYICKQGRNIWYPDKCYFGFRFVLVQTDLPITGEEFTAHAIYSDMKQTGTFHCGNEEVDQLFSNAVWSMKSNFVDIPTDCPTRERSGYSGDLVTFIHTAMYLFDVRPVVERWLAEQAATQFKDGCVRQVAPRGGKRTMFDGGVGWSDSIVIVTWRLWKRYGDTDVIRRNYEAMQRFVAYRLKNAAKSVRLGNRKKVPQEYRKWFVDKGFLWGEWLEPGADPAATLKEIIFHGEPEIATAFLSFICRCMSEMAEAVGRQEDAKRYAHEAEMARKTYRTCILKDGRVEDTKRQCRYVRPVAMGMLEGKEIQTAVDTLAQKVSENGDHLNTGFLSTHELCRTLSDHGHADKAYDLLLQESYPGWLYPVKKGAVSIWEQWDGLTPEGKPQGSMNHYSYGAIVGWLFDSVLGIRYEEGKITICPHPDRRLGYAEGSYRSPAGTICSRWSYEGDTCTVTIRLPEGKDAVLIKPDGRREEISGTFTFTL